MRVLVVSGEVAAESSDRLAELLGPDHGLKWVEVPKKKAKRLVAAAATSISSGRYTHVVWVMKWMNHSSYKLVKKACKGAQVHLYVTEATNPGVIHAMLEDHQ